MTLEILLRKATALSLSFAIVLALPVSAQEPFRAMRAETRLRDVAIDEDTGTLYFAAYAREQLWKVNGMTGESLAEVKAGKGPVNIALTPDGRLIACVNKLSADVTVYETSAMTPVGTFPCGEGASDITAVGNAGFAVANSFGDSITVVNAESQETWVVEDIGRVPNAIAFSDRVLGVTTRLPAALLLLDTKGGYDALTRARVALPATPVAIAAEPEGRFLVATETELIRVNARTGKILQRAETVVQDLAVCGNRILALSGETLLELSPALELLKRTPLELPATRLDCAGDLVVLVAPAQDAWLIGGKAEGLPETTPKPAEMEPLEPITPEPAPAAPEIQVPEPREEAPLPPSEPEPVSPTPEKGPPEKEPDTSPPEIVEAEPVQDSKRTELEPAPAMPKPGMEEGPEPERESEPPVKDERQTTTAQTEPAPSPREAEAAEDGEMTEPETSPYAERPTMMTTFGTGAPEFTREAPPAAPTGDIWSGGLSKAFAQGWDFANLEGAFEGQDWEQPLDLKMVQATKTRFVRGEGGKYQRFIFRGDVDWEWAESAFNAQLLDANLATRELVIEKGHLERELSALDVDKLYYRYPSEEEAADMPLMQAGALTPPERARRLYTLGYGEAENVQLVEPFRELRAKSLEYDFAKQTGFATDVRGRLDVLYFGVDELEMLGPGEAYARDAWVTTCPGDPPIFRLRLKEMEIKENDVVVGRKGRLQIGKVMTPIYWPRWTFRPGMDRLIDIDFDSGRAAELGYYLNYGQRFAVTPEAELGFRFFPTEKEGVGFGIEGDYDYMTKPSSPLFRGQGDFRTLITTKERGYAEAYHRQELSPDAVLLAQTEYWEDRDIIKDFYYNEYRNRTEPRTFAHLTYTRPTYLATGTLRHNTSNFVTETERLPEATYHMLDRQLLGRLYVSLDTIGGFNEREPSETDALRLVNVARASMDLEFAELLNIVPFYEADLAWYSDTVDNGESDARFSNTVGVTAQSRFHRAYPGALGFSGFKHVVIPSMTYSYRPEPTMGVDETLRFDAYDNVYGRSRIESKIGNILFARDALTGEVWQAARLTLYHGNDFWNEVRSSTDYEVELDLRPRPWWGILTVGEHHSIDNDADLDEPYLFQRLALEFWEDMFGRPYDPELAFRYNAVYGDYDRILSYLYYDDLAQGGRFGARLGFAYTKTRDDVFNREILYGARYKLSERWAFAFEHRYDLEGGELYQQEYEIRKRFDCFDWSVQIRDRAQGWDFNVAISLSAFPGTGVKF